MGALAYHSVLTLIRAGGVAGWDDAVARTESENKISGSNLWGGSPACCITCNRQDTVGFYLVQGQNYLGANIPQNAQYEVTICLKSSLFRIKRNDLDSTMECAQDNLPIGVYRFFLNNYSGQMCQFKLTAMNYSD